MRPVPELTLSELKLPTCEADLLQALALLMAPVLFTPTF
jgi:hypothetical protein